MRLRALPCAAILLTSSAASAHFRLDTPTSAVAQAVNGDPQKLSPCGAAIPDNATVTQYQTGATIEIAIDETIFHAGHYRVAIAQDVGGLPPAPTQAQCLNMQIAQNPQLPIIADGLLVHNAALVPTAQSMQVKLPDGFNCESCVMQVVQHMAGRTDCFYYHCAKVTISPDAPPPPPPPEEPPPEEPGPGGENPDGPGASDELTGGCNAADAAPVTALLGFAAFGLVALRRRRRA